MKTTMSPQRAKRGTQSVLYYLFLAAIILVTIFPFVFMVLASFKTTVEIQDPSKFLNFNFILSNYAEVFERYSFGKPIWNSFFVAFMTTVVSLIIGLPAAYAISKYRLHRTSGAILFTRMQMKKTAVAPTVSDGDHKMNRSKLTVKQLAFCAMAIALGTILSNLKLFDFPTGGSITLLSMLVICLPGYWFGLGAGIATGVAYGVLQLLIDPYVLYPMQLVVDYLLAFGALGLSGLFSNAKFGLIKGYIAGVLGRYVFAVISGWIFFGAYAWEGWDPLPYSLAYNAIYIFAEAAITLVILSAKPVRNLFVKLKEMALND